MKNMMNAITTSITKTPYGIGTGISIPDEMVKGIDRNQLNAVLTNVLSSVYSAIYEDEQKQMEEMLSRGICPMCGEHLGDEYDEDEDEYDPCDECHGMDCPDCPYECDCEDEDKDDWEEDDEDEKDEDEEVHFNSVEDIITYLNSIR